MSTELESWKYFAQESVQEDDNGGKILDVLPGSVEMKATFSMPLMFLQGIMGGLGFIGVLSSLRSLKNMFDAGVASEMARKMSSSGGVDLAMAESQTEYFFLMLTILVIKIIISCGFMGAAVMLEKRVDYANWIASLIVFGAIIYNMIYIGIYYMVLPDFAKYGLSESEVDWAMTITFGVALVFFILKMVIYLGLMTFLNNKTNNEIFSPKARVSHS